MFQLIRLANYTECEIFLEAAAAKLGTIIANINNSNLIGKVRTDVRKRYRKAQHCGKKSGATQPYIELSGDDDLLHYTSS